MISNNSFGRLLGLALLTGGATFAASAIAQPLIETTSASGEPGDTGLSISIDFFDTVPASTEVIDVRLKFRSDVVENFDLSGCDGNELNGITVQCSTPNPGQVNILVFPFPPEAIDGGAIGTIAFDIQNTADFGTFPIEFILEEYTGPDSTNITPEPSESVLGSVTVQAPPGGFYSSTPAPGEQLDLGAEVVGSAATPTDTLIVSNASADDFTITGFNSTDAELSLPAGSFTVPGDGSVTFDGADAVTCTPSTVGDNTGSFSVAHDAADGAASEVGYDFVCVGQAPNVQVDPTTITLNGSIGGTAPTAQFTVSNPDNDTASDAQNVQLSEAGDAEISITDGLTNNEITVDESDAVEVSCDTSTDDQFSKTIAVSWEEPQPDGSTATATTDVTVNCDIANVAPGYTSDPAVGSTLAFNQVVNGDTSAAQTIAIGNDDSVGSGAQAELEITGAVLSDSTNYSFSPDPFTATLAAEADDPSATVSLDVTCNPQSIGDFSGETLTVQTNDGDQVYNLSCEGTSNAQLQASPGSAIDGRLSIGTVAPGTTATRSLTLSNAGTDELEISCTLTDNNAGVIGFATAPSFPVTVPPDASLDFEGTPGEIATFEETLDCTVTDPSNGNTDQSFSTVIAVRGRPLVVPTMSSWGLIVMSLMMLLVGGFATRRMMA